MWLLLFVALFIAVAFFLPRYVEVERNMDIQASPKTVFNQINDLHSWSNWSKWNRIDPEMTVQYYNHGVGKLAGYKWESKHRQVGNGRLEIVESVKYDSIVIHLSFVENNISKSVFKFNESENGTNVSWSLHVDLKNNPIMRWMGLRMGKSIGRDFEEGLINLNAWSKVMENKGSYVVELTEMDAFKYASIRGNVSFNEISLKMGDMYGQIAFFLEETEAEMAGMPYAIYHLMDDQEIDLECGIPISMLVEGNEVISTGTYEKTKCVTTEYYGDYHELELGHDAIQNWLVKHGFELSDAPLEVYVTDPGLEPNPENWLTRIYYPVN